MEQENEISKKLLREDDEQVQELDNEDVYNMDYEEDDETFDEDHEINPDYIFREDNKSFLLRNGSYQIISDEVMEDMLRLRNEKE